jgi:hypothetical protein
MTPNGRGDGAGQRADFFTIQALVAWAGKHGNEIRQTRDVYDARVAADEQAASAARKRATYSSGQRACTDT